ncbi:hypothetical protein D9M71_143210 [compost metagenome]
MGGRPTLPCTSSGQLPSGLSSPESWTDSSSRARDSESMRIPSPSQWAAACSFCNWSLPSRRKLPRRSSPIRIASGRRRTGRLSGSLLSSGGVSGRTRSMRSAITFSRHSVRRSRQDGDQSSSGWSTARRVSASLHARLRALQCPPRRPWKPSTARPGTQPRARRLPVSLPSSTASTAASSTSRPSSAPRVHFSAFIRVPVPWRSGCGSRRPRRGRWRGRGAAGRPARPSARRCRRRS